MASVFIVNSSRDKNIANYIATALKEHGVDVFIDSKGLRAGSFSNQMRNAATMQSYLLVLISKHSINSDRLREEVETALQLDKKVIAIATDGVSVSPHTEGHPTWIDTVETVINYDDVKPQATITALIKILTAKGKATITALIKILTAKGKAKLSPDTIAINRAVYITGILVPVILLFLSQLPPPSDPKVSLAYSFLLDTSDAMKQPINGVPRFELAKQAIEEVINFTGFDVKDTWRVLRKAGGESCEDTEKVVEGSSASMPPQNFMSQVNRLRPEGANAYEEGINESLNDFLNPGSPALASEVKVAFILFASLDPKPCSQYQEDLIDALRVYKPKGIKTGLCLFGLGIDLPGFQKLKDAAAAQGVDTTCFTNFDESNADDDEIAKIAIGVIQRYIGLATNEQEITSIPQATVPIVSNLHTATIATSLPPTWPPAPTVAADGPIEARGGPGLHYPVVATIPAGQQLNFEAISADRSWAQVTTSDGTLVWVSVAGYGENLLNTLNSLPVIPGPTNTQEPTETPTETPTFTPTSPADVPCTITVTTPAGTTANVRTSPTVNSEVRNAVSSGQTFAVLSMTVSQSWYEIDLGSGYLPGWISRNVVKLNGDCPSIPIVADEPNQSLPDESTPLALTLTSLSTFAFPIDSIQETNVP